MHIILHYKLVVTYDNHSLKLRKRFIRSFRGINILEILSLEGKDNNKDFSGPFKIVQGKKSKKSRRVKGKKEKGLSIIFFEKNGLLP